MAIPFSAISCFWSVWFSLYGCSQTYRLPSIMAFQGGFCVTINYFGSFVLLQRPNFILCIVIHPNIWLGVKISVINAQFIDKTNYRASILGFVCVKVNDQQSVHLHTSITFVNVKVLSLLAVWSLIIVPGPKPLSCLHFHCDRRGYHSILQWCRRELKVVQMWPKASSAQCSIYW